MIIFLCKKIKLYNFAFVKNRYEANIILFFAVYECMHSISTGIC